MSRVDIQALSSSLEEIDDALQQYWPRLEAVLRRDVMATLAKALNGVQEVATCIEKVNIEAPAPRAINEHNVYHSYECTNGECAASSQQRTDGGYGVVLEVRMPIAIAHPLVRPCPVCKAWMPYRGAIGVVDGGYRATRDDYPQ